MTDNPVDRIRPLEGAGLFNMMSDAEKHGFHERRRWKWAGPLSALVVVAFVCFVVLAW